MSLAAATTRFSNDLRSTKCTCVYLQSARMLVPGGLQSRLQSRVCDAVCVHGWLLQRLQPHHVIISQAMRVCLRVCLFLCAWTCTMNGQLHRAANVRQEWLFDISHQEVHVEEVAICNFVNEMCVIEALTPCLAGVLTTSSQIVLSYVLAKQCQAA